MMLSFLQYLQYPGKLINMVSFLVFSILGLPHMGQLCHFSLFGIFIPPLTYYNTCVRVNQDLFFYLLYLKAFVLLKSLVPAITLCLLSFGLICMALLKLWYSFVWLRILASNSFVSPPMAFVASNSLLNALMSRSIFRCCWVAS